MSSASLRTTTLRIRVPSELGVHDKTDLTYFVICLAQSAGSERLKLASKLRAGIAKWRARSGGRPLRVGGSLLNLDVVELAVLAYEENALIG